MYERPIQVQTKVHVKTLLVVTYHMFFLRCAIDVVQAVVFKQFLETELSNSPPIIVRECIFKNQSLYFAPR